MKLRTEVRDRIFILTIDRPEVRNAIDGETAGLLRDAWIRFRDDDALWVAILTGSGDLAFSSGADLGAVETLGPGPDASPAEIRRFVEHGDGYLGYTRGIDIDKPILAAVNGDALAGGLELACFADMRIVAEHARLGVACRRWNVPLVDGGTQRLPRIVGMGHAMDLMLTGRFIDAREAWRMGLANEVVVKGPPSPAPSRSQNCSARCRKAPCGPTRPPLRRDSGARSPRVCGSRPSWGNMRCADATSSRGARIQGKAQAGVLTGRLKLTRKTGATRCAAPVGRIREAESLSLRAGVARSRGPESPRRPRRC